MACWWAGWNVAKLAAHRVTQEEAEQAYDDPDAVPVFAYPGPDGWERAAVLGLTQGGRLLVVVWETRPDADEPDAEPWTVIITAYPPPRWQRDRYWQRDT
jgi:uncharacterized DUF497 family protein